MSDSEGAQRRALLKQTGAALAAFSGVALVGCGTGQSTQNAVKRAASAVRLADVQLLSRLLELERRTVAAYTAGIPLLRRAQVKVVRQLLNEELEHTGQLLSLIKAAGGHAAPRAASYDIGHPAGADQLLTLLHELERTQIAAYLAAIPELSPGPVRAATASILSSDAQHIAIVRLFQGKPPTRSALVTGRE
ncbi:MAG: ferritin-like domain-containing protein [Actinomycetota bacterium]|nr:ferritin-like domain-containing protein [Actinomycetota bacterium]